MTGFPSAELYEITRCRDCHNAIIDLDQIERICQDLLTEHSFSARQRERIGEKVKAKYHDIFKIAIAGCPNSCSQPQVKDFGLQGQAVPEVGDGCTDCGLCVAACPDNAIILEGGPQIDRSLCLNCGKCARSCPTGTIRTGQRGYRVIWGGKLGRRPMLAKEACLLTNEEGAAQYLQQAIELLLREGKPGERFGALLERINKK